MSKQKVRQHGKDNNAVTNSEKLLAYVSEKDEIWTKLIKKQGIAKNVILEIEINQEEWVKQKTT